MSLDLWREDLSRVPRVAREFPTLLEELETGGPVAAHWAIRDR
ncbi:hypothetical protein [Haloterrigena alkaliphila]|nr:hypothetical protein [Haloterrigena alkaliphila]